MTTISRTDQAADVRKGIDRRNVESTRIHTNAIQTLEYAQLVEHKSQGRSCGTCASRKKLNLYTEVCKLKQNKQIKPGNICCHWNKI